MLRAVEHLVREWLEVVDIDANGAVEMPTRDRTIVVPRSYEVFGGGGNTRADHGTTPHSELP